MASLSQIPMCGIWVDLLDQSASGLTHAGFIEMIPEALLRSAPEALILTVSVHAANQFSRHVLKQIGLPILSTMAGIIISIALSSFAGSWKNLVMELGTIVVMSIGIIILLRTVVGKHGQSIFSVKKILYIIIDAILAVIACAYASLFIIVVSGHYSSPGKAFARFSVASVIFIMAAVIRYLVSFGEDDVN